MNWFYLIRVLHLIYLGLLIIFIAFYFLEYKPLKMHHICAESSAKQVLGAKSETDPFTYYQTLYQHCLSK